ncbi:MAG: MFS transporter, partial [Bacteroidetes bacterium]|nr:MFS transporter [Bacteroidota bacterium]
DTGEQDFFWLLIVRGFGLSLLFIPITTLALSSLKGKEIGEGSAFTGMMRQLGGSFGIAVITTFVANISTKNVALLSEHLNVNDLDVQQRMEMMKQGFMAKGMSPEIALQAVYKALDITVQKQATVIAYMDVFLYLGILFLICIPFVLLMKQKKGAPIDMSEAMH